MGHSINFLRRRALMEFLYAISRIHYKHQHYHCHRGSLSEEKNWENKLEQKL